MAFEFRLPDIGEGLTEATVVRWLVALGSEVAMDEPIVEIETDKAVVEIPAPRPGVVLHHGAEEGSAIAVNDLLVVIGDPGEEWEPGAGEMSRPAASEQAAPIVGTLEEAESIAPSGAEPNRAGFSVGGVPEALPLVRRLAASLGVDVADVRGSGPGGRVTRENVEAAAHVTGPVERVRMSPTRLAIARNLTRSWQEIPHVTTYGEADAAGLLAERSRRAAESGERMPLEAILMDVVVPLLAEHREFNALLDGNDVLYRETYDLAFAVDTPSGLMVAVVRNADRRSIEENGREIVRLAAAAKERKITASEMRGATFTISNIGAVGGRFGTPIIPYGTSAILSVGRADERPVVRDGELTVGREFPLSLSYDHRIIDGAKGRAFMAGLIAAIEARS